MGKTLGWNLCAWCIVGGTIAALSCGEPPEPENYSTPGAQVIDDDDYEHLPTTATTPTPTPLEAPTPEDTPSPTPVGGPGPTPFLAWQPNLTGTIYPGDTSPLTDMVIRIAFYNSVQRGPDGKPIDPNDFASELTLFPPLTFPLTFSTSVPRNDYFIAEAWQDTNQDGTQNAGDLVGDSELFFSADEMVSVDITLTEYTSAP